MSNPQVAARGAVDASRLHDHCAVLRSLHVSGTPLVLPNAWDVASARAVAAAGFPVVATTSAGVAATLGHADHEGAPAAEMLTAAARIAAAAASPGQAGQGRLLGDALDRARAYFEAGVDCVFPIALWERDVLKAFTAQAPGPVNVLRIPPAPDDAELAKLGVARISYGGLLHHDAMDQFGRRVASLA
jgi:2-methylisocitrate lyase-like PEP mutase family enzyme